MISMWENFQVTLSLFNSQAPEVPDMTQKVEPWSEYSFSKKNFIKSL